MLSDREKVVVEILGVRVTGCRPRVLDFLNRDRAVGIVRELDVGRLFMSVLGGELHGKLFRVARRRIERRVLAENIAPRDRSALHVGKENAAGEVFKRQSGEAGDY